MAVELYVSPVAGQGVVARFELVGVGTSAFIGARRDDKDPRRIVVEPEAVEHVPAVAYAKHKREYDRAVREGALRLRTKADFDAWNARVERRDAEQAKERKAAKSAPVPEVELETETKKTKKTATAEAAKGAE